MVKSPKKNKSKEKIINYLKNASILLLIIAALIAYRKYSSLKPASLESSTTERPTTTPSVKTNAKRTDFQVHDSIKGDKSKIIHNETGDVSFDLPKSKLQEIYKEILMAKRRAEVIYQYQLWRNADFRLRRENKLSRANRSEDSIKIMIQNRNKLWQEHLKERSILADRLLRSCQAVTDVKKEVTAYHDFISKELK